MQGLMVIILLLCTAVLVLHHHITQRFPAKRASGSAAAQSSLEAAKMVGDSTSAMPQEASSGGPLRDCTASDTGEAASSEQQVQSAPAGHKPSVVESLQFLSQSPQIQCLGIMSLSQGLTTNLLDLAWKTHLHMLHPSPTAYAVGRLASCLFAEPVASLSATSSGV